MDDTNKSVRHSIQEVFNDTAKCGMELMDDYNKLHMNNKEYKHHFLLTMKVYWQRYSNKVKNLTQL